MHFLLRTDDGPVVEACSSFQARRRARCRRFLSPPPRPGSAFFGSSARGTCGSVGISAAVVVATWRTAMLDDPRVDQLAPDRFRRRKRAFCVCAHQPRIAGNISGRECRQPPLDPLSAQCSLPPPLTLGSRRWHKLNFTPRAETDQQRSRQARAARRPQLPHALRHAEWPLPGRRQSAAGQAMKGRSGSTPAVAVEVTLPPFRMEGGHLIEPQIHISRHERTLRRH